MDHPRSSGRSARFDATGSSRRREVVFRLLAVTLSTALCLGALEWIFRAAPDLLPEGYRWTYPVAGIELFEPGILTRTPIDGVPVPYRLSDRREVFGPPPHDLELAGFLDRRDNPDRKRYRHFHSRLDELGFLNPRPMERADVVFVGDSFARMAGVLSPPGLAGRLEETTGLEIFNLGIPAIGPLREAWLLENYGLARKPRAVVWFFFSGNDLEDIAGIVRRQRQGQRTYADRFPDFVKPPSLVVDLLVKTVRNAGERKELYSARPGFRLETREGTIPIWFNPTYLRLMTRSRARIEESEGWTWTRRVLQRVAGMLADRGIRFLVVFVPSKPQVYVPLIERDDAALFEVANLGTRSPIGGSPTALYESAVSRSDLLEELLAHFCTEQGIAFLPLTGRLRDQGRRGELGYLAADSHWNEAGQSVALAPLVDWLKDPGRSDQPVQEP